MKKLTKHPYNSLVKNIKQEMLQGRQKVEDFVKKQATEFYWRVGRMIEDHLLEHQKPEYGKRFFEKLAKDVNIDMATLRRSAKFYQEFPNRATWHDLEWSKAKVLLAVKDIKKRNRILGQISQKNVVLDEVKKRAKMANLDDAEFDQNQSTCKITPIRGKLLTCKVFDADFKVDLKSDEVLVDLGFYLYVVMKKGESAPLNAGDIVEIKDFSSTPKVVASDRVARHLYTYKCYLNRVVDGDTIIVDMDFGAGAYLRRQVVRFKHLNTPEMKTEAGQRAKEFVENRLLPCQTLVIRTRGKDIYGRYLAEVWYLSGENNAQIVLDQGILLNQELLDCGMAEAYIS